MIPSDLYFENITLKGYKEWSTWEQRWTQGDYHSSPGKQKEDGVILTMKIYSESN